MDLKLREECPYCKGLRPDPLAALLERLAEKNIDESLKESHVVIWKWVPGKGLVMAPNLKTGTINNNWQWAPLAAVQAALEEAEK